MPIYEFKCPNGHVFEVFQRMSAPDPDACQVCGESPVHRVLYPVAVHFKGSGFYATDYGRGSRKREAADKDGDGAKAPDAGEAPAKASAGEPKTKAAEA